MDGKGRKKLEQAAERMAGRMRKAERNRYAWIGQTAFLSSLALMFVLPIVAGAYLGQWLDGMFEGYSVRWTVSLIVLGIVFGIVNVYLFIKGRP